jgi:hypothetical protein
LLKDWKYGSSSRACLAQGPEFKLQYQEKEREREREREIKNPAMLKLSGLDSGDRAQLQRHTWRQGQTQVRGQMTDGKHGGRRRLSRPMSRGVQVGRTEPGDPKRSLCYAHGQHQPSLGSVFPSEKWVIVLKR